MLKRNLNLIIISMFLFCALFLYYTASPYNGIYYYRALYTLADAYVYFLDPRVYGMLILPFVIILLFFGNETKAGNCSSYNGKS